MKCDAPPSYVRAAGPSKLHSFKDQHRRTFADEPEVAATVICERLKAHGFDGSVSIVKRFVVEVRPPFARREAFRREEYRPALMRHVDWWHTGVRFAVGRDAVREALGLVVTLPLSAAQAVAFKLVKDVAAACEALVWTHTRLEGAPERLVFVNDTSIVASRARGSAQLHDEVAALHGRLCVRPVVLRRAMPTPKDQVERTIRTLKTSLLPLRTFTGLDDLQGQHDVRASEIADAGHRRRVGAVVTDALLVERDLLGLLPDLVPMPSRQSETRVRKDGFVRAGWVDYSVPPGLVGRRVSV